MSVTPATPEGKQCRKSKHPKARACHRLPRRCPPNVPITAIPSSTSTNGCATSRTRSSIYLEAQNRHTEAHTGHLGDLSKQIFNEIKSRVKETDMSVPSRREATGTTPERRRASNTGSVVAARFPATTTGHRPRSVTACPARRSPSTPTSRRRVPTSSASARSASPRTATGWLRCR